MNNHRPEPRPPADPRAARSGLSLRLRLMLMLLAVFGVIQVSASLVRLLYVRRSGNVQFNERLTGSAARIADRLRAAAPPYSDAALAAAAAEEPRTIFFDHLAVALYDEQGTLVAAGERPAPPLDPAARQAALADNRAVVRSADLPPGPGGGVTPVRGRSAAEPFTGSDGRRYVLCAATPDTFVQYFNDVLSADVVLSTPIALLAAAVAGWFVAGVAVRPIQQLSLIAAGLRPETLQDPIDIGKSGGSEMRALQSELDRMRRRLETGYEAQERFVANVSHEIKTPIATVLTEAQTIPKALTVPGEVRQFIDSTQDEMRRLGRLVESFLLLTRVRHGKPLETTPRTVGVNELVLDSVQHCRKMADQYAVKIWPELAVEDERELMVRGDPELLRTMVDNLIRNAIRFSPRGQLVHVLVRHGDADITVCVRDKGPGIPHEMLDKIFDRFSQAKGEEKLGRGSGLGLEIAQGIAELHDGKIVVQNIDDDGGCEFCANLPLLPSAPAAQPLIASPSLVEATPPAT
jgi:two-component system OmpR family sensor kinase